MHTQSGRERMRWGVLGDTEGSDGGARARFF